MYPVPQWFSILRPVRLFPAISLDSKFTIKHHLHCLSTNVVYLINCKKCGFQYIRETKRTLKTDSLSTVGIPNINVTNQLPGISTNLTTRQKISSSWPSTDQARMIPITDWLLNPSGLRNLTPSTPLVSISKVTVKNFSSPLPFISPILLVSFASLPLLCLFSHFYQNRITLALFAFRCMVWEAEPTRGDVGTSGMSHLGGLCSFECIVVSTVVHFFLGLWLFPNFPSSPLYTLLCTF